MGRIQFSHSYEDIISIENLLAAWKEFLRGKRNKEDVQQFQSKLFDNIQDLHVDLKNRVYRHAPYKAFNRNDPKPRDIHKAVVRDRLLHHAIYRMLYPFFDRIFISDSYSCRNEKGTHKAIRRFKEFSDRVGRHNTKTFWILKCDIKKFFASIDHGCLIEVLEKYIPDKDVISLLAEIIKSFQLVHPDKSLPLGNLTSQLFVNEYMNVFDHFVKHKLKARQYIRYADDFVIMNTDRKWLQTILEEIRRFLKDKLFLDLHPDKISISTLASGVDFLGWVHFPTHRVLRTSTKRRMLKRLKGEPKLETVISYKGMLEHGNAYKLKKYCQGIQDRIEKQK